MRMAYYAKNQLKKKGNNKQNTTFPQFNKNLPNGHYRNLRMDITGLNNARSSCGSCGGK